MSNLAPQGMLSICFLFLSKFLIWIPIGQISIIEPNLFHLWRVDKLL